MNQHSPAPSQIFHIAPLIRITLLGLYIALTLPLPALAAVTQALVPPQWLALGIGVGAILLFGVLCERVETGNDGIAVTYPNWIRWWKRGWFLSWAEVDDLKMRTTGQGGLIYYFVSQTRDRAYLLPMRITGFRRLLDIINQHTEIDTTTVKALAQPWMYFALLGLTTLLLCADGWTLIASWHQLVNPA